MINSKFLGTFYVFIIILLQSCSEQDNEIPDIDNNLMERKVSYTLEGDFSGKLDVTFLSSTGFTAPDPIIGAEIPWGIDFNIPNDTQAIGGFASGLNGDAIPGEAATLKMFLDDILIETSIRTSNQDALIIIPLMPYTLEFDRSGTIISNENIGKDVTYTLDGDFSGDVNLIYKVADGSSENIIISELPWQFTFETTESSYRASISGIGSNGIENEEIEFNLIIDGVIIESERVQTNEGGEIGLFPEIFFEFD